MAKLVSVNEASQALGVSTFTVRRLVKLGRIRSVRVGKRLLLPEKEVLRVATEGCEVPQPPGRKVEGTWRIPEAAVEDRCKARHGQQG